MLTSQYSRNTAIIPSFAASPFDMSASSAQDTNNYSYFGHLLNPCEPCYPVNLRLDCRQFAPRNGEDNA